MMGDARFWMDGVEVELSRNVLWVRGWVGSFGRLLRVIYWEVLLMYFIIPVIGEFSMERR